MRTPEQQARETIDALLGAAGWTIQNIASLNLHASRGVAVREMQSHGGPADYILFVDGKALGIVEAKKEGTTLSAVAEQSARYTVAKKWIPQRWADPLPFTYESTGIETNFRDQRDPDSRSRLSPNSSKPATSNGSPSTASASPTPNATGSMSSKTTSPSTAPSPPTTKTPTSTPGKASIPMKASPSPSPARPSEAIRSRSSKN